MSALEQVRTELGEFGLKPRVISRPEFLLGGIVAFSYDPDVGRFRGQTFQVGIGFQENAYPEYPPHFLLVANLSDATIPVYSRLQFDGCDWSVFSVPPSDFWDHLPSTEKNMKTYMRRHIVRFWSQI